MDDKLFKILKKTYCKKKKAKDKNGNVIRIDAGDIWDTKTKTTKFSTDVLTELEIKMSMTTPICCRNSLILLIKTDSNIRAIRF